MDDRIHLSIVTNHDEPIEASCSFVLLPSTGGELGILPNHAPLISSLREGVVKYTSAGETHYAAISGGVMSVADNELIVLARTAERAETIDLARAVAAEKRARERLETKSHEFDMRRVELSLQRAMARERAYKLEHEK